MGCGLSRHRGALAGARRRGSLSFFEKHVGAGLQKEVALLAGWFAEGGPGRGGRLDSAGLAAAFGLPRGQLAERLHQLFDKDGDGGVGFREFVYGLSKFHSSDSEAKVEFAFRLFDRDGDGELGRDDLEAALKAASDPGALQWAAREAAGAVHTGPARKLLGANRQGGGTGLGAESKPSHAASSRRELGAALERAVERSGRDALGYAEYRALAARWPPLSAVASALYKRLRPFSTPAHCLVLALPKSIHVALLNGLGMQPYAKSRSMNGLRTPNGATPLQLPRSASKAQGGVSPLTAQEGATGSLSPAAGGASGWLDVSDSFDALPGAVPVRRLGRPTGRSGETGMLLSDLMSASWSSYSQRQASSPTSPQVPLVSRKYGPNGERSIVEVAVPNEVAVLLRALGLTQCQAAFDAARLRSVESIRSMSGPELRSIGVSAADAAVLRGALQGGRSQARAQPRTSSDGPLRSCRICMSAEVQVCTKPCGHAIMCLECSERVARVSGECPLCRCQISECIRLFTA